MNIKCLYDKLVGIGELKAHPKNRNKHSKEQVERLAKILNYQGWRYPIKISKQSGYVTSGHGRWMAAKYNKWTNVPVNYQDYENEDQEYADVQSDNSIAVWAELDIESIKLLDIKDLSEDFDVDLLGIKGFEKEKPKEDLTDPDDIPEVEQNIHNIKLGDIILLGNHRLMCGDSTKLEDVEKLMDGHKADMVFTDPPYGINLNYKSYDDSEENWFELINKIMPIIKNITNCIIMPCCRIKALKWWYENHSPDWIMCWYKGSPGHRSHIGFNDWEPHLVWGKPKNQMHDYWQTRCGFEVEGHPCPKPVEYAEWILTRAIDVNQTVLDLFGGSGTTLITAEKTNRKCFMMELDPHYCSVIIDRWQRFTGNKAEILSG